MPNTLRALLDEHEQQITDRYVQVMQSSSKHYSATPADELERNVHRSLHLIGTLHDEPASEEARSYIRSLCEQRVPRGFRLQEVMSAIFMLGDIVVPMIREKLDGNPAAMQQAEDELRAGLNRLALLWSEGYYDLQEELMQRKEQAMRQLSTPVTMVWDGILTLPVIGDVDDLRSRQITEDLLDRIIGTQSSYVLLDITGIGNINTGVIAQLIRTVRAAELLGTECWIVGVSPEVAQTIVNLGVDLGSMTTFGSLKEGLAEALQREGLRILDAELG